MESEERPYPGNIDDFVQDVFGLAPGETYEAYLYTHPDEDEDDFLLFMEPGVFESFTEEDFANEGIEEPEFLRKLEPDELDEYYQRAYEEAAEELPEYFMCPDDSIKLRDETYDKQVNGDRSHIYKDTSVEF